MPVSARIEQSTGRPNLKQVSQVQEATRMKNSKKSTPPVISAVMARDLNRLQEMIANSADVDALDRDGRTASHHACIQDDQDCASALLAAGADASIADSEGRTALHFAARNYNGPLIGLLFDAGAKVDAVDCNGNSALANAVFESKGRGEVIKLLIQSGADKHMKNKHGVAPMDLARTIANFDVAKWMEG